MHILHRVLVNLRNVDDNPIFREDMIDEIRDYAKMVTEDYCPHVYDWRETKTAGRWSDEYPENVILSREGHEKFFDELKRALKIQHSEIDFYLKRVCEVSNDIKVFAEKYKKGEDSPDYNLKFLSELLSGTYTSDSGFYNTESYDAKITPQLIEEVKKTPDDWALVFFDYHY